MAVGSPDEVDLTVGGMEMCSVVWGKSEPIISGGLITVLKCTLRISSFSKGLPCEDKAEFLATAADCPVEGRTVVAIKSEGNTQ